MAFYVYMLKNKSKNQLHTLDIQIISRKDWTLITLVKGLNLLEEENGSWHIKKDFPQKKKQ